MTNHPTPLLHNGVDLDQLGKDLAYTIIMCGEMSDEEAYEAAHAVARVCRVIDGTNVTNRLSDRIAWALEDYYAPERPGRICEAWDVAWEDVESDMRERGVA